MHRLKAILDYSQEGIESVGPWWGSGVRESCSGRFYGFALLSMVLLVLGSGDASTCATVNGVPGTGHVMQAPCRKAPSVRVRNGRINAE